jgi:hypothetical protein
LFPKQCFCKLGMIANHEPLYEHVSPFHKVRGIYEKH